MSSTHPPTAWPYDAWDRVVLGWKGLVVGIVVAAGIGRLSVWKLVRINHAGEPT